MHAETTCFRTSSHDPSAIGLASDDHWSPRKEGIARSTDA